MSKQDLAQIRQAIDGVDKEIVELLNRRAQLARQAGAAKTSKQKIRPEREEQIISRVVKSKGELPSDSLKAIYREIISACLGLEGPVAVGYLGPEGTYSEEAARARFGSSALYRPYGGLADVLAAAEAGHVDLAVLPIENSTEGSVNQTLDLLLDTSLKICAEVLLPVRHQLLSKSINLADIKTVVGHPQALAQCRNWLLKNLPQAEQVSAVSNAEAAKLAQQDSSLAAVAGKRAAEIYDLPILHGNIQDRANNTTRFIVLGNLQTESSGQDKTSLICSVPNRPGSLYELLGIFAKAGVNLVKLESRPSSNKMWDYLFYVDIDGHQNDKAVAYALNKASQTSTMLKLLGSYPKDRS